MGWDKRGLQEGFVVDDGEDDGVDDGDDDGVDNGVDDGVDDFDRSHDKKNTCNGGSPKTWRAPN